MASHKEGKVQKYAQQQLKAAGFLVRKIAYEGRNGATDLIAIDGIVGFIECKDEGKEPDAHQAREHERLKKHGAYVFTVDSEMTVDIAVKTMVLMRCILQGDCN